MQIPHSLLDDQNKILSELNESAKNEYLKFIENVDFSNIADARENIIEMLNTLTDVYGLDAGKASAYYYDAMRAMQTGEILGAEAFSASNATVNRDLVQGAIQSVVDTGEVAYFNSKVINHIGKTIRKSAGDTVYRNGAKDPLKPRFARVPGSGDTCEFCLMLASRGFKYLSEKTASNTNDHYHANCKCIVVAQFDKGANIEGYDPDAICNQWEEKRDARLKKKAEREKLKLEKKQSN